MYIYIYIYTYVYTYIHIYIYIYVYACASGKLPRGAANESGLGATRSPTRRTYRASTAGSKQLISNLVMIVIIVIIVIIIAIVTVIAIVIVIVLAIVIITVIVIIIVTVVIVMNRRALSSPSRVPWRTRGRDHGELRNVT